MNALALPYGDDEDRPDMQTFAPRQQGGGGYPEGTAIENDAGQTMVMQGGKWILQATPQMARTLPNHDAAYLAQKREEAARLRKMADLANQFQQANRQTGTGGEFSTPGLGGFIADAESTMGLNPNVGAMQSLTRRMIPLQREKGAGPIRVQEIAGPGGGIFGGDVPRVQNPGDVNHKIVAQWNDEATKANDYVAYLDSFASRNGTITGADQAYQADVAARRRPWQQAPNAMYAGHR